MMKARIHGIEIEGTPEEMASLLKLVGELPEQTVTITRPNPYRDTTPPHWPHPHTWISISDSVTAPARGMLWNVI